MRRSGVNSERFRELILQSISVDPSFLSMREFGNLGTVLIHSITNQEQEKLQEQAQELQPPLPQQLEQEQGTLLLLPILKERMTLNVPA